MFDELGVLEFIVSKKKLCAGRPSWNKTGDNEKLRSETNVITYELLNSNELKVKFMKSERYKY